MTDTRSTKPAAWTEEVANQLYYAARGVAEHEIANSGTARRITDARVGIAGGCYATLQVLREAGWLRDEPSVDVNTTRIPAWEAQARPKLEAWDEDPEDGDIVPPTLDAIRPTLDAIQAILDGLDRQNRA